MIDDTRFTSEAQLQAWCDRLGGEGLRGTGSDAHERVLAWLEAELTAIPGLTLRHEDYGIARWRPVPEGGLERAGVLSVDGEAVPAAGAVPYSLATEAAGELVYLPPGEVITAEQAAGRIVLRDFPAIPVPYDLLFARSLYLSPDCGALRGGTYDRSGMADGILHRDLLAAGEAGAAGLVIGFDLPREQVAGYFEPHQGTQYALPAIYAGGDEFRRLLALTGRRARIAVGGRSDPGRTRNLFATLPGQSPERVILCTHTDGATWVQENGPAALLALARYFAALPLSERPRTIEFAFTSAHLHISQEGSVRYARQLDAAYDGGGLAFVLPLEHLGAREVVPVPRGDGPGRRLAFTGQPELLLWAVGPSAALEAAVTEALRRRALPRTLLAPGFGPAVEGRAPRITSFGGLGTNFHAHLLPTVSAITGPWSLWAPALGRDAIDAGLLRRQALAAGDIVLATGALTREAIAGGYLDDRQARAAGAPGGLGPDPPEFAPRQGSW